MDLPYSILESLSLPFGQLRSFCDQPALSDLDIADLPVTFVDDYKVCFVITGRTSLEPILAFEVIDKLHLASVPLLSMSLEFSLIQDWVSARYFKNKVDRYSILAASKLYLYLETIDNEGNLNKLYEDAQLNLSTIRSLPEINDMSPVLYDVNLLHELSEGWRLPYGQKAVSPSNGRSYYPLIPHDLFWDVGFSIHTWGFVE